MKPSQFSVFNSGFPPRILKLTDVSRQLGLNVLDNVFAISPATKGTSDVLVAILAIHACLPVTSINMPVAILANSSAIDVWNGHHLDDDRQPLSVCRRPTGLGR